MKKMLTMVMVMVMVLSFATQVQASKKDSGLYAITTVVVELDKENDEVICIDFNGHEWVFTEIEDWLIGDIATMIMDDKNTDIIYDDEIVSVRYSGWLDGAWGWDAKTRQPIIEIHEN